MSNKKLKILYTLPNFDTAGSGKALLNIATRLNPSTFEPMICCMHDRGESFQQVRDSGIPFFLFTYTGPMIPRFQGLKNAWTVSRFFRKLNADIIHSFHYLDDYSEPLAAKMAGVKWVYTKKNMSWSNTTLNSWKVRSMLADGIVTINSEMRELFFKGSPKICYIARGIDTSEFTCGDKNASILDEFRLRPEHRLIISVANLVPVKGIEILIKAFESINLLYPNIRLMILGDDTSDYAKQLKKYVNDKQLQDKIFFAGKRRNVNDFLRTAEIFVLPTLNTGRKEGFGVVLSEAMASCILVLGSDMSGIRDQLQNFPELRFEPGNIMELAQRLRSILEMAPEERLRKRQLLREEVLNKFTIEKEVEAHEKFYHSILAT